MGITSKQLASRWRAEARRRAEEAKETRARLVRALDELAAAQDAHDGALARQYDAERFARELTG